VSARHGIVMSDDKSRLSCERHGTHARFFQKQQTARRKSYHVMFKMGIKDASVVTRAGASRGEQVFYTTPPHIRGTLEDRE
jgi:hypothetical protein